MAALFRISIYLLTSTANRNIIPSKHIVFVYCTNDPWTGGGISDEAVSKNPNMLVKVVDGIATHTDAFLHRDFYTKDSETTIVNALNKFLKLK